jgi:hypothetical protein
MKYLFELENGQQAASVVAYSLKGARNLLVCYTSDKTWQSAKGRTVQEMPDYSPCRVITVE